MRRFSRSGLFVAGLVLVWGGVLAGYTLLPARWTVPDVPFYVNTDHLTGMTPAQAVESLWIGFDAWTIQGGAPVRMIFAGWTSRTYGGRWATGGSGPDGVNVVDFIPYGTDSSPGYVADTYCWWDGDVMRECDVRYRQGPFPMVPEGTPCSGGLALADFHAHEAGHVFGLGHSDVPLATMTPWNGTPCLERRWLDADDLAAIAARYVTDPVSPPAPKPCKKRGRWSC